MKIESVTATPFRIPFAKSIALSTGTREAAEHLLVEVRTADGVSGYAECIPRPTLYGETVASARVVIDTNIFVPGVVGAIANPPKLSASAELLRAWRGGLCTVIVSDELLAEYLDVLQRPPFSLQRKRAQRIWQAVAGRAVVVSPPLGAPLLTADPNDDWF